MKLTIIVPCYNEECVIEESCRQLSEQANKLTSAYNVDEVELLFVDDGSEDATWSIIKGLSAENPIVNGLKLSHNVGHQNALWAGFEYANASSDAVVSIDADLQDDVEAISKMVDKWLNEGVDVVFGVRSDRGGDTVFKRTSANGFYNIMVKLNKDMVYNHADFRLMNRRALTALLSHPERNLFIRGLVGSLGYKTANVYYKHKERFAGESKYPLSKMLSFAIDGITSFSVRPLRYISFMGAVFILFAIVAIMYALFAYIDNRAIPGWTSLLVSLWFIGGTILLALGVIGEYVGKIYSEVKHRPRYFIEETIKGRD